MVTKIFDGVFVLSLNVEIVKCILKASTYQEFKREIINFLSSLAVESSVGIVETLDQTVSNWVGYCLVAVTFFEIESCSSQSVFHVIDDAR